MVSTKTMGLNYGEWYVRLNVNELCRMCSQDVVLPKFCSSNVCVHEDKDGGDDRPTEEEWRRQMGRMWPMLGKLSKTTHERVGLEETFVSFLWEIKRKMGRQVLYTSWSIVKWPTRSCTTLDLMWEQLTCWTGDSTYF